MSIYDHPSHSEYIVKPDIAYASPDVLSHNHLFKPNHSFVTFMQDLHNKKFDPQALRNRTYNAARLDSQGYSRSLNHIVGIIAEEHVSHNIKALSNKYNIVSFEDNIRGDRFIFTPSKNHTGGVSVYTTLGFTVAEIDALVGLTDESGNQVLSAIEIATEGNDTKIGLSAARKMQISRMTLIKDILSDLNHTTGQDAILNYGVILRAYKPLLNPTQKQFLDYGGVLSPTPPDFASDVKYFLDSQGIKYYI